PRLGAVTLILAIGSLGLPGLGNFVGEFLVLLGTFADARVYTVLAALGLVAAAVYSLVLVQRAFHGALAVEPPAVHDFGAREMTYAGAMIVALVVLGVRPQPAID